MSRLFPGFGGLATGLAISIATWLIVWSRTRGHQYHVKREFEIILPLYFRVAELIVSLAAGSIVVLVGSSAFRAGGRLPWYFISPLFLLMLTILYGVSFMVLEVWHYEDWKHNAKSSAYGPLSYTSKQVLGFSSLACFFFGYVWLILRAM